MEYLSRLSSLYHLTLGRFTECSKLYCLNLSAYHNTQIPQLDRKYKFVLVSEDNITKLKEHYYQLPGKEKIVQTRFDSGNYICFAYEDTENAKIAYTRWLCKNEFYSDLLQMNFSFSNNEVLTLDSYTEPSYRKMGLHHAMNIEMLNWLKDNTETRYVFMIIKCFIPHLTKIPLELGYRPVKTRIYLKKDGLSDIIRLVRNKLSGKAS